MTFTLNRLRNSSVYQKVASFASKIPPPLWGVVGICLLIYSMIVFANTPVSQSPHVYIDNPTPTPVAESAVQMASKIDTYHSPFGNTLEETKINQYYPAHTISSDIRHRLRNVVPTKM